LDSHSPDIHQSPPFSSAVDIWGFFGLLPGAPPLFSTPRSESPYPRQRDHRQRAFDQRVFSPPPWGRGSPKFFFPLFLCPPPPFYFFSLPLVIAIPDQVACIGFFLKCRLPLFPFSLIVPNTSFLCEFFPTNIISFHGRCPVCP